MPKKKDEIYQALKRKNPSWSENKLWAIATATYNKLKG